MIVGFTLHRLDGEPYYSASFPRGGLAARFAFDITHVSGSPTFQIDVEHRDETETTFAAAGSISGITAINPQTVDLTALKQILRFKYAFDAGDDPTDAVHLVVMAPSWRPYP